MKVLFVVNARMPTERAHGIQIAKMVEAFIEQDDEVELVVPRRGGTQASVRDFYDLRVSVPTTHVPVLNVYRFGSPGFFVGSLSFAIASLALLVWRRLRRGGYIVYTVDTDTFSSSLLPLAGMPVFTEMHTEKPAHLLQRFFLRRVRGVIAVNRILERELRRRFPRARFHSCVEQNGVDGSYFEEKDKAAARTQLGLDAHSRIVLYVGRFLSWKGLEVVPEAARLYPQAKWYLLGGTREKFVRVIGTEPVANMVFVGSVPQSEISWWMAAADVLLVLGTRKDAQSWNYTSPMKLFEYFLSRRPIIACRTPALREIASDAEVLFYEPDTPHNLADKVREAIEDPAASERRAAAALRRGLRSSWRARAARIRSFIETSLSSQP